MKRKIVAGNWKMNCGLSETEVLLNEIKEKFPQKTDCSVMLAPAFTNLHQAYKSLRETPIKVVAQNMHQDEKGAFTGEISPKMLKSIGVETVILGHSERRAKFFETDEILAKKVDAALENEMTAIFCVGEELSDRKENNHFARVESQLKNGLFHSAKTSWENIVIAYEPVWAIGTGETATPEQAQEMHAFIRKTISGKFGDKTGENVSILYGGSVKPNNAKEIFAQKDVDGGLIGGASLNADDFVAIIEAIHNNR